MKITNIYPDGNGNQVIEELDTDGNVINRTVVSDGPINTGSGKQFGGGIDLGNND